MTDHIAAAVAFLVFVTAGWLYYHKVVKPADEARLAILACMAEKGDVRGPDSLRHYDECSEDLYPR